MMFGSGLKWGTEGRAQTKAEEEVEENKSGVPTEREDAQMKQEEKVDPMGMNKKMRSTRTLSMALQKSQRLENKPLIDADAVAED